MRDPVITPSGITYERKDIEEHLQVSTMYCLVALIVMTVLLSMIADWCLLSTVQDVFL